MNDLKRTVQDVWKVIQDETGVEIDTTYRTTYVDSWREWFNGHKEGFHNYTENVMGQNKAFERKSLGSASATAKAWADILTREFPVIALNDEEMQKRVEKVLNKENFKEQIVKYLELGFGVGTSGIVEYIVDDTPHIDFLDVDDIVPLDWKNGIIYSLATINMFSKNNYYYVHIQYNKKVGNDYVIENSLYQSDNENFLGKKIDPMTLGIDDLLFRDVKPFFQVIRPNILNKVDIDNPLGAAIFYEKIDTLKAIDNKYTLFDKEFCLGKKRIILSSDALAKKLDPDSGQWVSYMGSDDVYQAVNRSDGEPLFEIFDPTLREQSYINALNQEFNFLADGVGMDSGSFLFNGVSMKTATEVISEKSKTFGNKQKHDKMFKTVLKDCVQAIVDCFSAIDDKKYEVEITITTSDSVLIDSQTKKADERIDVQNELMPKTVYLMRNYGLSEEEANEWVSKSAQQSGGVSTETIENMFMP